MGSPVVSTYLRSLFSFTTRHIMMDPGVRSRIEVVDAALISRMRYLPLGLFSHRCKRIDSENALHLDRHPLRRSFLPGAASISTYSVTVPCLCFTLGF